MPDLDTINTIVGWLADHSPNVGVSVGSVLGVLTAAAAVIGLVFIGRRRAAKNRAEATTTTTVRKIGAGERLLTFATVAVGLGFDAQGNWAAFSRIHSMSPEVRKVLFLFLPLVLLMCAVRGRRNYLSAREDETPSLGFEGQVMWAIAAGSAIFATTAATDGTEVLARLALPLVAAWALKRLIVGEYAVSRGINTTEISGLFRNLWDAAKLKLVRVGLLSADRTSLEEEDLSRRIAKLAIAAYRMHKAPTDDDHKAADAAWKKMIVKPKYARVMEDPALKYRLNLRLAGMYQSIADTSPEALKKLDRSQAPTAPAPEAAENAAIERARTATASHASTPRRTETSKPKQQPNSAPKSAAPSDAKDVMKEFIRSYHEEHGAIPSHRLCDQAAGTNGYSHFRRSTDQPNVRDQLCADLGIEVPVKSA